MDVDVIIFVSGSVLMFLIYLGFLVWAIKSGQFKDVEKVRSKPLEEEDEK